jgi:ABC-type multidrug transport system fused ATPase/permease subunit
LNQLSHVGATISSASAGTERVFEILDSSEEVQSGDRPVVKSGQANSTSLVIRGAVAFEAVSFAYRPKQRVLNQITFQLQPGQSAAIIGPSGAGKTTLLNLVPRFFDPDAGRVILDGVDLKELRLRDLRAHVALVPQEPILLSATVSENISYGRPDASAAMIEAAAVRAHAAEFIEKLPQRYDTIIGEGAAHLSVGEKQRLSLARAFLKDAPILLLDEPTSALDLESEQFVLESLLELMRGRTTLMVAHRLTTIRHVNQILVLEHGELIEQGAPEKLLQSNGYYARILKAQSAT